MVWILKFYMDFIYFYLKANIIKELKLIALLAADKQARV